MKPFNITYPFLEKAFSRFIAFAIAGFIISVPIFYPTHEDKKDDILGMGIITLVLIVFFAWSVISIYVTSLNITVSAEGLIFHYLGKPQRTILFAQAQIHLIKYPYYDRVVIYDKEKKEFISLNKEMRAKALVDYLKTNKLAMIHENDMLFGLYIRQHYPEIAFTLSNK
jgi:hypothetical protein